jgi:O-antigen/teichoic acid export membrane protein
MTSDAVSIELKNLLRQSAHYLAVVGGTMALGFVSFPIFTRMFSVSDYGTIDYVQKIVLLLTAGAKLGLQNSALRFYESTQCNADREIRRRYYSTFIFSIGPVTATVSLTFSLAIWLLPRGVIDAPLASVLCLAGTLVFLRGLESMFWSFLRAEERTNAYGVVNLLMKAATIASVCFIVASFGRSPRSYFSGVIGVEAVTVAFMVLWLIRRGLIGRAFFDWQLARKSVIFGLPLVVYELSSLVLDSGDRFLVKHYLGAHALGLYSVAYGLSSYVNELLVTPLGLALIPVCIKLWNNEGREKTAQFLSTGLDLFLMAACGLLAGVCALAGDVVVLLASSRYTGAERLIPMLVGGLLIYTTYLFLSAGLWIQKGTMKMARAMFVSAGAKIGLNMVLLPRIGVAAADIATFLW